MSEEPRKYPFKPGDESNAILMAWWASLAEDKGGRAILRRASSPTDVIFVPAYHQLLKKLQEKGYAVNRESLAVIAGLAAHVKENDGTSSMAKQMAASKPGSESARVSGLRFRRILVVTERNELYPMMIRVIRILDGRINLANLANAIYGWNENIGKPWDPRKQWAYDYYETAPAEQ